MLFDTYLHWVELHLGNYFTVRLQESLVSREAGITVRIVTQKRKLLIMSITFMGSKGTWFPIPLVNSFSKLNYGHADLFN